MRVELEVGEGVPQEEAGAARERLAGLDGHAGLDLTDSRLTLRHVSSSTGRPLFAANAAVVVDGRLLAVYATGETALGAASGAADRLRRRLERHAATNGRILVPANGPAGRAPPAAGGAGATTRSFASSASATSTRE